MREDVVLVAASGLAKEVISSLTHSQALHVRGIVDDDLALRGTSILGVDVLGPVDAIAELPKVRIVVCAGRGSTRQRIVARLAGLGVADDRYATVIDSSVSVPPSCSVGAGSILLAHAALTADVSIGRHVVVMPNVTLTHDDVIADFATLCAGVSLGGSVTVHAAAYLGMNACVRENTVVGAGSIVGMGAVVLAQVAEQQTVVGCPARDVNDTSLTFRGLSPRPEMSSRGDA